MILKPIISPRVGEFIALSVVYAMAPLWALPLGLLFVIVWAENKVSLAMRPGPDWEPWFAWRPVRIDVWTGDDVFAGTVWLETVYRRYRPMCGVELTRALPAPAQPPGADSD